MNGGRFLAAGGVVGHQAETGQGTGSEEMSTLRGDLTRLHEDLAAVRADVTALREDVSGVREALAELRTLPAALQELRVLRGHDASLVDKLHAENATLRKGELATALTPLLSGLLRLHDQMDRLSGGAETSDAALLKKQLLQTLDTAAGITPYSPDPGTRFDSERHHGVGVVGTADRAAGGTVARTVKVGFARLDRTVVRAAEVEIHQWRPTGHDAAGPDNGGGHRP